MMAVMWSVIGQSKRAVRNRKSRTVFAVLLFAPLCLPSALAAGPREDRAACWDGYSVCVLGAERAEQWRTVCYSDYSSCMKNPGEIQCREEDKAQCEAGNRECTQRGDGSGVITYHCNQDHQVCLDSFGC